MSADRKPRRRPRSKARPATPRVAHLLDTIALVAFAALLLLPGLGSYSLWDPDEGRHAQIARSMAADDRWLIPEIYGEPYYDKPSPYYWLLRGSFAIFGTNEVGARVPSALATLATVAVLHRFALASLGRVAAALGTAIYATTPLVVILGRYCNLDATLTLFSTLATLAWLRWLERPTARVRAAWAAMGLGTLIKGPIAILLPLLVAAAGVVDRRQVRARLWQAELWRGWLIVGTIVLPFLLAVTAADPAYPRTFLFEHNVARYFSREFEHVRGPLFFFPVLLAGFFPWWLLLPAALQAPAPSEPLRRRERDLAIWGIVVVVFFSGSRAKLAPYVLPALPGLSLWLGSRAARAFLATETPGAALAHAAWAFFLTALPVGVVGYLAVAEPVLFDRATPALIVLGSTAIAAIATWRLARSELRLPAAFALGNAIVLLAFYALAAPIVSDRASDESLARAARTLAPNMPALGYRIQPASFSFYMDETVRRADHAQDIVRASEHGSLLIVTRRQHAIDLRLAGIPLHEWLDAGRHTLFATVPPPPEPGALASSASPHLP